MAESRKLKASVKDGRKHSEAFFANLCPLNITFRLKKTF